MSKSHQQERGAAPAKPGARKDWEWFWRIIAGLMLIVIAWIIWVLYQISPRSVVTPMAYEPRVPSISTQATAASTQAADVPPPPTSSMSAVQAGAPALPASQPAAEAAAAGMAMDQVQAAARAGAHQSSADMQAAALEQAHDKTHEEEQSKREGLKLSTEIVAPPVENKRIPGKP